MQSNGFLNSCFTTPEIWQMKRADLIPFERTRPIPTAPLPTLHGYSEAALEAHSAQVRFFETTPPHVPNFPVGSWAVTRYGDLYHLRHYRLDDPRLIFPEGDPYGRFRTWPRQRWVIEKYASWIRCGSDPPPLEACETERWSVKIGEGHHRAEALVEARRETCQIWVAPIYLQPETGCGMGLTHELAIVQALRQGQPVPYEVLAEYPHLLERR